MNVMWKVREFYDKATNIIMNYTEVEAKVREATNDEAWGPTGRQMQEISQHTFTYEYYPEVMNMLWKRMLQDNTFNWRRTYKSLQLLNYLVIHGSERVVTSAREHIYDLRRLENYTFVDETGKDQGINVRQRTKLLIDLIQDDDKIRIERKKAKQYKDKFIGVSNESSYSDGYRDRDNWSDSFSKRSDRYEDDVESKNDSFNLKSSDYDVTERPNHSPSPKSASPKSITSQVGSSSINSKPTLPKSSKPLKKIDLGAAALYAQQHAQASNDNQKNINSSGSQNSSNQANDANLLGDIFENLAISSSTSVFPNPVKNDSIFGEEKFADFSQISSQLPSDNHNNSDYGDEFTNFQSAFDSFAAAPISDFEKNGSNLSKLNLNNKNDADSFVAMNPFLDSNIGPLKEPTSKHLMDNLSLLTPVQVSNGNIEHKSSVSSPSPNKSSTLKIGLVYIKNQTR
ncbi:clathrin interactor 1-like protein [Sarcoptes scabiei]|uniref:Clathrin interactor 1-like protein n=1 Tax=Sarcoptes scabiei TaxID=52283 RepID=A0A131ZUC8_SARSC|nr:clathrin interactor 1-like protein [Sarcoptes scabiei]